MRVFVVESDGGGGLLHYAYQLCQGLNGAGCDVTLVTGKHFELRDAPRAFHVEPIIDLWPAIGTSLPAARFTALLVRIGRKVRRVFRAVRYAWAWHRLTRYLLRQQPDVVQFSVIRFPFQAVFLRRLRRRGLILTQVCHEFEPRERGRISQLLHRAGNSSVFECFDRIYLHGEASRRRFHELFAEIPLDRTMAIKHGNESLFTDLAATTDVDPSHPPVALFFGGLRPSKGLDDLIDAWELVRYEVDARLLIAGEPEAVDPAVLWEHIDRVGVTVSVEIDASYQPVERVAELMGTATVVVLPYRSATASGVLQVAYAFARPVVASAVGALGEDVEDGTTGLLVPPNDPPALARALIKLLSDPAEASRMGAAAGRAAERFGWDEIARTIATDYEVLR